MAAWIPTIEDRDELQADLADMRRHRDRLSYPPLRVPGATSHDDRRESCRILDRHIARTEILLARTEASA